MVGNAAPPPSVEPKEPATVWGLAAVILAALGVVFAVGSGVVGYAAHLLGYF